jgi:Spy/CpxP family protein refolding chaperone
MLKKHLLILLAASLISIAAPLAGAQSNDSQSPPNNQQPAEARSGGHRGPDPAQRTQELTEKLNLTSDQQTKVQNILESERSQMENVRHDTSVPPQDRHTKMMDIRQTSDTQIRALLDSTQQKKWDEMQANRRQMGQGHRHGGDQQSPPPQQ